ncbi:membrane protein involved in the export of O-antigen and teichoic acid [Candidatus Methanoperedens nitroreducens]|uniref:Membrane protein involved in the export of O-antigen and teichoic acid n=2 Tax=Candidatus Methanoperedens nitratireducens TaxID=1392998 RepID=A0A062V8S4_9EURY|nr:membrane protein involved in the export of O-antigen and teichoic acid [Candidatus Methanoperedens nitroreducens]
MFDTFLTRIMSIEPVRRQSIVSLIWQIALTFIGFLSTMYFAHAVGAGVLGVYFLFLAYLSIIGLVTDGGFGGAAVKRISEGEEQDAYFSAYVVLRSVFVTVVVVVLIAFRSYFAGLNDAGTFIWLLMALIVSLLYGAVSGGMQGCGKMGIHATGNFINNISRIFVQVVAVFMGYGVAGLAGGFVVGIFVGSIVQLRFFDLCFVRFRWGHIKSLSTFSLWVFFISSGMIVYSNADTVMIGYYLSNADVGVYRIVLQFTSMAMFTTAALQSTLYPRVSRWGKTGDTGLIEGSLSRAFTYSLILVIPMFVGGFLLGDKLLYYFYGAEFGRGYTTMVVLFLVQIVNIFYYLFTTYLTAMNHLKDLFKITVVAVTANIVLNATLIPVIGIAGAAIATLVTMGLNAVLAMWVLSRMITVSVESGSLLNILKAAVVMSLVVGGYRILVPLSNVWLALVPVVLGAVVYGVLVLKFDRKIYEELKGIMLQMNLAWPAWL